MFLSILSFFDITSHLGRDIKFTYKHAHYKASNKKSVFLKMTDFFFNIVYFHPFIKQTLLMSEISCREKWLSPGLPSNATLKCCFVTVSCKLQLYVIK